MKHSGFYCFSSSSVTLNGLSQVVVSPRYCKNDFSLPNIFSKYIFHWYSHAMCWPKLSILGRDNADFLLPASFEKIPEIEHWKIKLRGFVSKFWLSFTTVFLFFPHVNKIWLNQTSVFAHRSNIGPPANILSRRICRIGSQDCIAWGLQTARIKLYHTQREIFVLIEFWMLFLLFFFFWKFPLSQSRELSVQKCIIENAAKFKHCWWCHKINCK